ncbi:hypothetical protein PAL_GLEAN10002353 [Pteropus alecto]|uniref:Uncharacterized protein n=1 Tax=Pteropus alecto TaxID=9402 RepID=L5KE00_PTEAL|nr:hypothetical protein PAL_GLEAN10002353 [Pteropus alecto]
MTSRTRIQATLSRDAPTMPWSNYFALSKGADPLQLEGTSPKTEGFYPNGPPGQSDLIEGG